MNKKQLDSLHKKWMINGTRTLRKNLIQAVPGFGNADADIVLLVKLQVKQKTLKASLFLDVLENSLMKY